MSEYGDDPVNDDESVDEFAEDDKGDIDIDPLNENIEESIDKQLEGDSEDEDYVEEELPPPPGSQIRSICKPEDRLTRPIIVAGEWSALICNRVMLLQNGERIYIDPPYPTSPIDIAIKELKERKFPLLLMRDVSNHTEIWDPNTMIHPRENI